jgi:hypothetical protein
MRGLKRPTLTAAAVTPRRFDWETILRNAMQAKVLVNLRYKDDLADRLYQPEGMWETEDGGVYVAGVQLRNPNKTGEDGVPHNFTVGKIATVRLTDASFPHRVRFDRFNAKYGGRVMCAAQGD